MASELAGVSEERVFAMDDEASWSPRLRAVLSFARKLSLRPAAMEGADIDALRPWLTEPQIVELCLAICRYNTMNRLADAFGVPLEGENVFAPEPDAERHESEDATPALRR